MINTKHDHTTSTTSSYKAFADQNPNTEFIQLTELWNDREYTQVGRIINEEEWSASEIAEFCAYFAKYVGLNQLNILYKFL